MLGGGRFTSDFIVTDLGFFLAGGAGGAYFKPMLSPIVIKSPKLLDIKLISS